MATTDTETYKVLNFLRDQLNTAVTELQAFWVLPHERNNVRADRYPFGYIMNASTLPVPWQYYTAKKLLRQWTIDLRICVSAEEPGTVEHYDTAIHTAERLEPLVVKAILDNADLKDPVNGTLGALGPQNLTAGAEVFSSQFVSISVKGQSVDEYLVLGTRYLIPVIQIYTVT